MEIIPYKDNNVRAAKIRAAFGMFLGGSENYGYYKITTNEYSITYTQHRILILF